MIKGKERGGKYATPIRQMLNDKSINGIIFQCENEAEAESARVCMLILKGRNGYSYKTSVLRNKVKVYKYDPWDDHMVTVDLRKTEV